MRWATRSTWARIGVLFSIYLLIPALWSGFSSGSEVTEVVKGLAFLILLVILPLVAIGIGAWDGVKEGFSLLWVLAPFLCFLAPMFLFFNESALIYGAAYSVLGVAAHALGAFVYSRRRGRV
ncbi:iron ABC transporter [Schaalia meyeri]|uniref:Iron ABC transporter n=1 Tax=Schaalia meyeri TaxID=52773 RepID=A0AAQ0BWD8_9ACTO|nr:hypothetical protein [Schaalia meyeri]AKU64614.1 iron ABC transporter [Schaalia meyeri]QQC43167.1 iron ABC transporter [Schaalia meyeri]SDS07552.1 hypothetical protein SAMN04489715_1588 [Schaalia meyeri]